MHIPANYSCDSWAVLLGMTRDLCIILFMCSLLKLSHELYLHLHMCSLVSLLNMRSLLYLLYVCFLLKCDYLFCNYPLSLFVILRLELHVYIMLTFMFCEINDIYIYIYIYISPETNRYIFTVDIVLFRKIASSKAGHLLQTLRHSNQDSARNVSHNGALFPSLGTVEMQTMLHLLTE